MTAEIFAPPHVKDVALTRLKDAHARYQRGEINGREEAGVALLVVRAIAAMALGIESTDPLLAPLNALHDALNQLDDGATPDLLRPTKKAGPTPASQGEAGVKAIALFTAHMLIEQGANRENARKAVAKQLNNSGFEHRNGKSPITERTVREWDESAQANPQSETARLRTTLMQSRPMELSGRTPGEAQRLLLTRLHMSITHARSCGILQQKPR